MLKIGVSACFMYPDNRRPVFAPKTLSYLENDMAVYLSREGVLPFLIPDVEDMLLEKFMAEMDGFVFQGGTDVAPESFGEQPIENGRWKGDPVRDKYELKVMDLAVKSGKPIFAICRGMQLMNVYFGGTLYQDTTTQQPGVLEHRNAEKYDHVSHAIEFTKEKILQKIYHNNTAGRVNSVHHQSIKELGKHLEVLAHCPEDNVIEAIGYTKAPEGWVMGVQWHPEFSHTLGEKVIDPDILYDCFLGQVRLLKSEA
ncbi:gamma-glutamyl-gamma-aminobutyrate hydrolase family protein [Marinoscillum sp. MHG1-6]|uniref:gamma-glutamyl-gamma-aminobutyrate hydrolase family protein n=1 Tax=Marinoscillum sp. MHG1-6 TaxID=2959627 RepID=UPI00215883A8|nr:gamma-glutamyl-gamma-aminobutyrate hydrolase family protein [Marinoscillum sp. MHG1-6]